MAARTARSNEFAALQSMNPVVIRAQNFVSEAAEFLRKQARAALAERGEFRVALSGGHTPRPIYAEFGRIARDLPWEHVRFTFGDERCVPPNDPESNFRMARETLFAPYAVPDASILRMRGEIDPQLAAQEYEDQLTLLATQHGETMYRHDLMLLGLGDDGHTASLFPGTAALEEQVRRVVANFVPELKAWRLTMTLPLINHSRQVLFLVSGEKNRELLERVLEGDKKFPAGRIAPANGELTWIIGQPVTA
jgi:6-phosphogluconolactonase